MKVRKYLESYNFISLPEMTAGNRNSCRDTKAES